MAFWISLQQDVYRSHDGKCMKNYVPKGNVINRRAFCQISGIYQPRWNDLVIQLPT